MVPSPLAKELFDMYAERPTRQLYHYTSLTGLMGIVESKSLYATDIRFFNDAAEMAHAANLIRLEIARRIEQHGAPTALLGQFHEWVSDRLTNGHMQFVASFTANGNILSQWRGYTPKGQGVSIGFHPEVLRKCSDEQSFSMGRCRYELKEQQQIATSIVSAVEALAEYRGENLDPSKRHPSNSFHDVFEEIEGGLLRVAALLKHPAFKEEDEWRVVSPITSNYIETPICYREGRSMLMPYILFGLPQSESRALAIEHVFLGPTPNVSHSMSSLSRYLSKYGANPRSGLTYCQIPYRDW